MFLSHASQTLIEATPGDDGADARGAHVPQALTHGQECEALAFLAARPVHTVIMASYIRDNGLVSPLNRGTFYGCRDRAGRLVGVALIGRAVLTEARNDAALAAFAAQTRACAEAHLIMGEEAQVARFWQHYAEPARQAEQDSYELLVLRQTPPCELAPVPGLRPATCAELEAVAAAHVEQMRVERGISPLEVDPEGFRARTVRRIEQGRVWVWIEGGCLIFKGDVVSETPQVNYLEGVYVHPAARGRGYGLRCLSQLGRELLRRTDALCLLVNTHNVRAREFYLHAGYAPQGRYRTIFLRPRD
jgi:uncharacterized protein